MVQGLAFLSKKSWHTKNLANQERVWVAEQQAEAEKQKTHELAKQIRAEREQDALNEIVSGGNKKATVDRGIDWMYQHSNNATNSNNNELARLDREKESEEYLLGKEYVPQGVVGDLQVADEKVGVNAVVETVKNSTVEPKAAVAAYDNEPSVAERNETFRQRMEDPMYAVSQQARQRLRQAEQQQELFHRVGAVNNNNNYYGHSNSINVKYKAVESHDESNTAPAVAAVFNRNYGQRSKDHFDDQGGSNNKAHHPRRDRKKSKKRKHTSSRRSRSPSVSDGTNSRNSEDSRDYRDRRSHKKPRRSPRKDKTRHYSDSDSDSYSHDNRKRSSRRDDYTRRKDINNNDNDRYGENNDGGKGSRRDATDVGPRQDGRDRDDDSHNYMQNSSPREYRGSRDRYNHHNRHHEERYSRNDHDNKRDYNDTMRRTSRDERPRGSSGRSRERYRFSDRHVTDSIQRTRHDNYIDDRKPDYRHADNQGPSKDVHDDKVLKPGYGLQGGSSRSGNGNSNSRDLKDLGPNADLIRKRREERTLNQHEQLQAAAQRKRLTPEERAAALQAMQQDALVRQGTRLQDLQEREREKAKESVVDTKAAPEARFLQEMAQQTHGIRGTTNVSLSERLSQNRNAIQRNHESFL